MSEHNNPDIAPGSKENAGSDRPIEASIYWNNICILNKKELTLLEELAAELAQEGIILKVRQFGLGYPEHLSEHLRNPQNPLPDIIVSADLEVYEDYRVFSRFQQQLYAAANWVKRDDDPRLDAVYRHDTLLPYVVIPLVLYSKDRSSFADKGLEEIVIEMLPLHFGGINNSAGKSVVKLVWDRLGRDAACALLQRCEVAEIPVVAFQAARRETHSAALVPTAFALTADGRKSHAICPSDGAPVVPSYIAARKSLPEVVARRIVEGLTSERFLEMFVNAGRLIAWKANSPKDEWVATQCSRLQLPRPDFFAQVSPEEFYQLYCSAIPSARMPDTYA
ncbi:MAG: ABC transporter substrate-binding protein [Coriobacteriales bacterium]|nr:ABC transporter substrate-binding protein [Coriobacteriales bacterium]